ncbi:MAG: chemotaxis protein CheX [Magnetococcales bacterium]|nr:chemotaxis protein CheX [Magnetococcales bacterium]
MSVEQRKKTRVPIHLKAEITTPEGERIEVLTETISFSGVKLKLPDVHLEWAVGFPLESYFTLKIFFPAGDDDTFIIDLQCRLIRKEARFLGAALLGIDLDSYETFKFMLINHSTAPTQILQEVNRKPGITVERIEERLLKGIVGKYLCEAMDEISTSFLRLLVIPGKEVQQNSVDPYDPPLANITATVAFNGVIKGGVHLSMPYDAAFTLAGALAQESFSHVETEMIDACGELANLLAGGIQTRLSSEYEDINLTPPEVIFGGDYHIAMHNDLSSVRQYFQVDSFPFFAEFFFSI